MSLNGEQLLNRARVAAMLGHPHHPSDRHADCMVCRAQQEILGEGLASPIGNGAILRRVAETAHLPVLS